MSGGPSRQEGEGVEELDADSAAASQLCSARWAGLDVERGKQFHCRLSLTNEPPR